MFQFGNRFGAKTPPATTPTHSATEAEACMYGQREALERAYKAYETKTAELTQARSHLVALGREEGQKEADGEDALDTTQAVQAAAITVKRLESAVAVLLQRTQEAEVALKNAQLLATVEAEAAACARVLALGPKGEALFVAVAEFVAEEYRETEALRVAGGNERYTQAVGEIRAQFELFLGIAKRPPSTKGADSGAYRKYENFTACLAATCGTRRAHE